MQYLIRKNTGIIIIILMMPEQEEPAQKESVWITGKEWTEQVSIQISGITHWEVKELRLYDNQRPTMLQDISHIHFTTLTYLNIGGNCIQSIEGLPNMDMAHIQQLWLVDNNIISVRAIRKGFWPALSMLAINYNNFNDIESLIKGYFPIMEIFFAHYRWGKDKNQFVDQCFVLKLQATSLRELWIRKNSFSFSRFVLGSLKIIHDVKYCLHNKEKELWLIRSTPKYHNPFK